MPNRNRHTGRAQRVRDWLQTQPDAKTPRQILQAVEPDGDMAYMCSTLSGLVAGGFVERIGGGKGKVQFKAIATRPPRKPGPAPRKNWQDRTTGMKFIAERYVQSTRGKLTRSHSHSRLMQSPPIPRRSQAQNFIAPISMFADPRSAKRQESARLAADIARFERAGGRVQVLSPGESSDPLKHDHDR